MHRTNRYLTEAHARALDARARMAGVSRSALLRQIIDWELSAPVRMDDEMSEELSRLADAYTE